MFFRPWLIALFALLFSLQATCAPLQLRSPTVEENQLESTASTESSTHDASVITPITQRHDPNDQIPSFHGEPDWRDNQALKLEAEREAGFVASSASDDEIPLPEFWPLFKICVVSAIGIAILKIIRDVRR
ncbi:hypothetical protein N7541_004993 [Penicillium brevicompactum]|uniref:Uncharacterized protein n=1 Tax=Penicillium brevicompactum TaxID=5074 RepID=A0A9W9UWI2_PENBR|nr:hypothetical protein N7541_004993 [Penicillium brevicompactum]